MHLENSFCKASRRAPGLHFTCFALRGLFTNMQPEPAQTWFVITTTTNRNRNASNAKNWSRSYRYIYLIIVQQAMHNHRYIYTHNNRHVSNAMQQLNLASATYEAWYIHVLLRQRGADTDKKNVRFTSHHINIYIETSNESFTLNKDRRTSQTATQKRKSLKSRPHPVKTRQSRVQMRMRTWLNMAELVLWIALWTSFYPITTADF